MLAHPLWERVCQNLSELNQPSMPDGEPKHIDPVYVLTENESMLHNGHS